MNGTIASPRRAPAPRGRSLFPIIGRAARVALAVTAGGRKTSNVERRTSNFQWKNPGKSEVRDAGAGTTPGPPAPDEFRPRPRARHGVGRDESERRGGG